jgi:O-antigen ligase
VSGEATRRQEDRRFWIMIAVVEALVLLVAFRSPLLAAALAAAVGVFALMALVVGTRRGTLVIGGFLVAVIIVLPGDLALQYRLPVAGGGIFIVDFLLALVIASMVIFVLVQGRLKMARSPLSLPILLFLGWVMVAAAIGHQRGNDLKLIVQDARALSYYVLFFFAVILIAERRTILWFLMLLGLCVPVVFAMGVVFAAQGQGMALDYVEVGVSRFPAPDDLFLMSSVMAASFIVVWTSSSRRPKWLWGLLVISLLGLVLSFVRGNWVAFVASLFYLLLVLRVRERMRLVAGGLVLACLLTAGMAVVRPALLQSVVSRALAVTAVQDRNVQWRLIENKAVKRQIKQSPIFGNGLGKDYLFDWSRYGVAPYYKSYIHNDYYWFVHRLGLIGLALFLWLAGAYLVPWMRYRPALPRDDPWLLGLVYGGRAMFVALLVNSVTSPRLSAKLSVTVLALVMGMSEVALGLLRERAAAAAEAPGPEAAVAAEAATSEASGSG